MNVLALNCGSSSVKFKLVDSGTESVAAEGLVEEIGTDRARFSYRTSDGRTHERSSSVADHEVAVRLVLSALVDARHGVLPDLSAIHAVGHRVVHGGDAFTESVVVDDGVLEAIRGCVGLAPLHNPHNLRGIEVALELLPGIPEVAVFDTAFHQRMPPHARTYALPAGAREGLGIRRYGFHGISHGFVAEAAAAELGRPLEELKMVTCHLGNGASMAAVKNGFSVDTSMGMTPLEGLVMGTRCGDIDPAAVLHLLDEGGLSLVEVREMLNAGSGLLGLSGVSSDMREILGAADSGNADAALAVDVFCHRARKYLGAYAAVLGGIDAVIFTGGIGENEPVVRSSICEGLEFLGIEIDDAANERGDARIGSARVAVLVVRSDEELAIARQARRVLGGRAPE